MPNMNTNKQDGDTILKIAQRGAKLARLPVLEVSMDLTATHLNGCPLDLERMLQADDFDLLHDVVGINSYLDRETGLLMDGFDPRYSKCNCK